MREEQYNEKFWERSPIFRERIRERRRSFQEKSVIGTNSRHKNGNSPKSQEGTCPSGEGEPKPTGRPRILFENKEKLNFLLISTYCSQYVLLNVCRRKIKCFTWIFRIFNFFFCLSLCLFRLYLIYLIFKKNVFLPFPSLGEGGGCKKILREIFSLELPVTGGRGRFYKVIYKFVWLCFRILNFWVTVKLRFRICLVLIMFGTCSVYPSQKMFVEEKRSNIRLLSRILIFLLNI